MNDQYHALMTPRRITNSIKRFLSTLDIASQPQFIRYTAIPSAGYAAGQALENCEKESARTGDPIVFGWLIWEDRKQAIIEAEFHAVIRRAGELVDITPRANNEQTLLFAVDQQRSGKRENNGAWQTWCAHKWVGGHIVHAAHPASLGDAGHHH